MLLAPTFTCIQTHAQHIEADTTALVMPIDSEPNITVGDYFHLLKENFVEEASAPFHQNKKDWIKTGIFTATTVGLYFIDRPLQSAITEISKPGSGFFRINNTVSEFGGIPLIISVAAAGVTSLAIHDDKLKNTVLMASQAYLTSAAFSTVIKYAAGRERPGMIAENISSEGRFLGPLHAFKTGDGSFPSRHTSVAFATATVFATSYQDSKWIPAVSYGVASLIGISRINTNEHWLTDVFAGAALGFVSGKQVMKRYRILKNDNLQKLKWNANYSSGHLDLAIRYTFE